MIANMETIPYTKEKAQNTVKFNYYEIWCNKRKYQILTPQNCSQFCVLRDLGTGSGFYPEVQIITNRKGLEALRDSSAALAEEDNVAIYFPCKKNAAPQPLRVIIENYNPAAYEYLELVLMKPNTLKISDWKEIRKRISKMEAKEWGYNFKCDFKDMKINPKYEYCESVAKQKFGFDTVFYNIPRHECPGLASWMEKFLDDELEEKFRKIIYYPEVGMLDCTYFYCNGGLEVEATFLDEDISQIKIRKMSGVKCNELVAELQRGIIAEIVSAEKKPT